MDEDEQISVERGQAQGVRLRGGEAVRANFVLANADVIRTYAELLSEDEESLGRFATLQRQELSCSGFVCLLGVSHDYEKLAHHNIFFSHDYRREFDDIFTHQRPPQDPTIYLSISSKTDPEHVPSNSYANWFVLVNAPALSDRFDWSTQAHAYRDLILDKLAQRGFDARPYILSETILTPADLASMNGAWRGALYGASANNKLSVFRRPHNRSPIRNLYFAGGTTHPGGGVPMVMLSGKVAAELLAQDDGLLPASSRP